MPRPTWPDPIYRAFFDAWINECEMPDEMWDERVDAFATRWSGLDADAFIHALRFGDEGERLCALFALGYLAVPDVEALLGPFLYSPIRKECWASAIGLGESRNEQAFVILLESLSETMEYHSPHGSLDLHRIAFDAAREARDRFGSSDAWDQILAPSLVQAWEEEQAYVSEYQWMLFIA